MFATRSNPDHGAVVRRANGVCSAAMRTLAIAIATAIAPTMAADTSAQAIASGAQSIERSAGNGALERPQSHESLIRQSERDGSVVVALFSLAGCGYCEAIRTDQLRHLAREARQRNLRVVEYEITDRRVFGDVAHRTGESPASPAELAQRLRVRVAPTVAFLGPDGSEIAERLVGYGSPDFYGAYLERRITQARERLAAN